MPLHLLQFKEKYNVLLTPGHYAPRFSAVPYVSAVMDLAFLDYPEQFTTQDQKQLESWTSYSVKRAQKVIAISEFTKKTVIQNYHLKSNKVEVI